MDRGDPPPRSGLHCPRCGTALEPLGDGTAVDARRMACPDCGGRFRARRRNPGAEAAPAPPADPPPVGSVSLFWRGWALRVIEGAYRTGVLAGATTMLALGGFVTVVRGWLQDEINDWGGVLEALGGVHVVADVRDPDGDLGPVLAKNDASPLFAEVAEVSRRLGVRPPCQIRLTYLPCCGVVAWGRSSQALILGLPLLRVLTLAELRAILAHELAHLARGDATRAARSARFVEALGRALDVAGEKAHGPLGNWARTCRRWSVRLIAPIARGQELRADRAAAAIAGGSAAASALVKVALVQPLFREVLNQYDPTAPEAPNLYAFFRTFWFRLSPEVHSELRLAVLASGVTTDDPTHPPLPYRLALVQSYPDHGPQHADAAPATTTLGDLEFLEQVLHNRLYALPKVEPSIFHKARA